MSNISPCGARRDRRPARVPVRALFALTAAFLITCPGCSTPNQRGATHASEPAVKPTANPPASPEVAPHPPFERVWILRSAFASGDSGLEQLYGGPLITDQVIYRHVNDAVRAVDIHTGKVLWEKKHAWAPVYDGEAVYAAADGRLVACDPLTGHERWGVPLADLDINHTYGDIRPIAARPGNVFCRFGDNVVAFDTTNRKLIWTVSLPSGGFNASMGLIRGLIRHVKPIIAADRYLLATGEFGIGCIDIKTGWLRWQYPPEGPNARRPGEPDLVVPYYAVSGIAADSARVYFIGEGEFSEFGALDLQTGQPCWRDARKQMDMALMAPIPLGGLALFVGDDGILHAVNAADGTPRWEFASPEGEKVQLSGPTVYGGQIFLHTGKALMALDASGRTLWTWRTQAGDIPNPTRIAVFNDGVLFHERGTFAYYAMVRPRASAGASETRPKMGNK